jgi:hypothetical protein
MSEGFRKQLNRNTSPQLGISGLIDVTHAAGTQMGRDFVMREFCANHAFANVAANSIKGDA